MISESARAVAARARSRRAEPGGKRPGARLGRRHQRDRALGEAAAVEGRERRVPRRGRAGGGRGRREHEVAVDLVGAHEQVVPLAELAFRARRESGKREGRRDLRASTSPRAPARKRERRGDERRRAGSRRGARGAARARAAHAPRARSSALVHTRPVGLCGEHSRKMRVSGVTAASIAGQSNVGRGASAAPPPPAPSAPSSASRGTRPALSGTPTTAAPFAAVRNGG